MSRSSCRRAPRRSRSPRRPVWPEVIWWERRALDRPSAVPASRPRSCPWWTPRGTCTFTVKVKNAQNAGALGVLVVNNAVGTPPAGLGGTDATITIPAAMITLTDGNTLKAALATRSRTHSGMFANLGVTLALYAGADAAARAWMYAPNPYQSGSSVSHWDISAFPNQLMEPAINGDLTHEVI